MDLMYTTEQAADRLGVDRRTIARYVQSGKLRGSKMGKGYRIAKDSVEGLLGGQATASNRRVAMAIVNQKGGVAKTTTTFNLGIALGAAGERVLIVDLDPQASLSIAFGVNVASLDFSSYDLLTAKEVEISDLTVRVRPGVDLIPATIDLSLAEMQLSGVMARERRLGDRLETASESYDFVLFDCPPSLGILTINALAASDYALVPVACEALALRGVSLILDTIEEARRHVNPRLRLFRILPTMHDARTGHSNGALAALRETYGDQLASVTLKASVVAKDAISIGQSIREFSCKHDLANAYARLAREVIDATKA